MSQQPDLVDEIRKGEDVISMSIDPVAAANAVAVIMQLIGLYRQEVGARKDLTHREFIEWLEHHRHEEIKNLITHTYHLESQVDELLRQDHAQIIAKLDQVNLIVADILARVDGLAVVAEKIVPVSGLSNDAIDILKVVDRSKSGELFVPGGTTFHVDRVTYATENPKFFHSDLRSLVEHGFLFEDFSAPANHACFRITRRGSEFLKLV